MKKIKRFLLLITLILALISSFLSLKVFAEADKTELQLAYNETETAITTQTSSLPGDPYYEVNSYQAFDSLITALGGLIGIQNVLDDPLALQDDVNNLTSDINNALNGLILNDTYYSTLANYSLANTIDLSPYTSDSQVLYNNELDRIELILNNPTSGEIAIQNLNSDISNASDLLVLRGDKTQMNILISQIETIYSSLGEDYIPSTFLNFKNSYDNIDSLLLIDINKTLQEVIDDNDALVSEVQAVETRLNQILTILVLKPDMTELIADYNSALNINSLLYTSSSFELFNNGLVLINNIIIDEETTEAEVIQASLDLENLYLVLVLRADISELEVAYNIASSIDLTIYTPNSVILYQNELSRINQIIESDDTSQILADQTLLDLQEANDILILIADKTNLSALNEILIRTYYEDTESYTKSSHNAFKAACDSFGSYLYINSVIHDDNAPKTLVESLEQQINDALDLLVLVVNNEGLLSVYYQLKDKDLSQYTSNSKEAYYDELDRLYLIIIGNELDSQTAAQVLLDLSVIDDLLIELADYTLLEEAISRTKVYREEDYTVTSFAIYNSAKLHALSMLTNYNATQEDIDSSILSLEEAIQGLKNKLDIIYIKEGKSIDIMQYVTLGQNTIIDFDIEDPSIIKVRSNGSVEALKYGNTIITVNLSNGASERIEIGVIASITVPVFVLTFSIPVISLGLGSIVVFGKKDILLKLIKNFKNIFIKKK